jgi:hypothetical protein
MELEKEDAVISEFLRSIGPWHSHIVIGGGYALIIYKLYLADKTLKNPPVGTRDIDSLIPRKIPEVSKANIAKHLHDAGFTQVYKDLDHPATESYVKEIHGLEVEIEFLTDSATRGDKHKNVVIAGVVAQPLSYMALSLRTTTPFQTYSGVTGFVVSPGAWIFHKGLTFTKRMADSKKLKDLYGIWYVASQLRDFSERAIAELRSLGKEHPKWYKTFQGNLRMWLENATPLDRMKLEQQDPLGGLKRLVFDKVITQLIQ